MNTLLSNVSVRNKININSGALLIALILFASFEIYKLNSIKSSFEPYSRVAVKLEVTTLKINRDVNYVSRINRSIMLGDDYQSNLAKMRECVKDIQSHFSQLNSLALNDSTEQKELKQLIVKSQSSTEAFLSKSLQLVQTSSATSTKAQLQQAWQAYKRDYSPVAANLAKIFPRLTAK